MTTTTYAKFPVHLGDLTGSAGNAFAIMGAVSGAHKQCVRAGVEDLPPVQMVLDEMTSGDYEHLLATVDKYCVDLDGSIELLANADPCEEEY